MSVGSRIRELREKRNLSRNDLADLIGVTVGAISNYENEVSSPKEQILFKIIEALECDANYIFQDVINMTAIENDVTLPEYDMIKKYRSLDHHGKELVDIVLKKEFGRCEATLSPLATATTTGRLINYYYRLASAGTGQIIFDMPPTKRICIPDTPKNHHVDYAIGVNGTSMEPIYHDGDTLLVEMTDFVDIGEIGIFLVDGECYVKERQASELKSLNPEAKNISLNESAQCMGRVIDVLSGSV